MWEPIDYLLARCAGAQTKTQEKALAYLFLLTRLGHLCLYCAEKVLPDPLLVLGEECSEEIKEGFASLQSYQGVVREGEYWYTERRYEEEKAIIENRLRLFEAKPSIEIDLESCLEKDCELTEEQKEALNQAARYGISVITGGPGTGKSFTAAKLLHYFRQCHPGLKIAVAAPTGKAAANLQKKFAPDLPKPQTLHRLLDYRLRQKEPTLLREELILVDESSMVDVGLFSKLLRSVSTGARLILLGDAHQLPPIEGGAVFQDLVEMHQKRGEGIACLRACQRTQLQTILSLCEAVKNGDVLTVSQAVELKNHTEILEKVVKMPWLSSLNKEMEAELLLQAFEKRIVLTPVRKGPLGVEALNRACRSRYGGSGCIPIMITRNDEELGLANGETGVLVLQGTDVRYGDYAFFRTREGVRKIPALLLPSFEEAYCLSVHKSQGSEYAQVLAVLPQGTQHFGRELLYTALTRAREKVELLGDRECVEKMMGNCYRRFSRIQ